MERKRQRELALGAAAVVIIGIAAYRITTATPPDNSSTASGSTVPAAAAGQQPRSARGQVPPVELEALQGERPQPVGSRRNPFRFTPTPPPAPPSRGPSPPVEQKIPAIVPGPVDPPPPPRITLKFIGLFDSGRAGKIAVFTDGRGLPIYGKEGQVIEGRYRILRIGVESVELAYLDGRGRQTIRQTGQ
jgi:hypothetical protein